jgi:hypothetical protein
MNLTATPTSKERSIGSCSKCLQKRDQLIEVKHRSYTKILYLCINCYDGYKEFHKIDLFGIRTINDLNTEWYWKNLFKPDEEIQQINNAKIDIVKILGNNIKFI